MDNLRMVLIAALGFVMLSLWQAWQVDYAPEPTVVAETQTHPSGSVPQVNSTPPSDDLPNPTSTATPLQSNVTDLGSNASQRISIETDVFSAVVDSHGGDIRVTQLKQYPVESSKPDVPFVLFNDQANQFYTSQGGLISQQKSANHHSQYSAAAEQYQLAEGEDSLEVVLSWSEDDIKIEKVFTFHRGSYLIDLTYRVTNNSAQPWVGRFYEQLHRQYFEESMGLLPTFTGGAISSPDKRYEKIKFSDLAEEPIALQSSSGWLAMIQHYFVSALVPTNGTLHDFYSKVVEGNHYIMGLYGQQFSVAPGQTHESKVQVFSGPKVQKTLSEIAPALELTVDYGMLWFIAKPIFWVLSLLHDLFSNWGWAIIFVTILIKAIFYPLSAMGYKSMARMRKVTPRLTAIRERYSNDKTRLNQAMMDLYREEKINPLGGCFPILIQVPVFLALYWVLLESVEMRQAPFMLWIQDLSIKDPYFILPLVMGISMYIQQKLNPPPPDPMQAKIMQFLPILFTGMFAFMPAGLVLYWVVNNILSIMQQWTITKQIEASE